MGRRETVPKYLHVYKKELGGCPTTRKCINLRRGWKSLTYVCFFQSLRSTLKDTARVCGGHGTTRNCTKVSTSV
jgi:hypothetical protein